MVEFFIVLCVPVCSLMGCVVVRIRPPVSSRMVWRLQDVLKHSYIMLNCG